MTTEEKRPHGRPEFVPTDDQREIVQVCRAQGMSKEAIAEAIGIHFQTLVKHFSTDLEVAVARKTAEVMVARYRAAMSGSVPAQNKFLELAGAIPMRAAKEVKAPKLGKKEQALFDAAQPDTGSSLGELIAKRHDLN